MKRKVTIKDFVESVDYELSDTFHHLWSCYGPDAYSIAWSWSEKTPPVRGDFWQSEWMHFVTASIVYDANTHEAAQVEVWDEREEPVKVLRWINPKFVKAVKDEYKQRGLNFRLAIDNVKYQDVTPAKIISSLRRFHAESTVRGRRRKPPVRA